MKAVMRQRSLFHSKRGVSPKIQKSWPFGSGRLKPPSRTHVMFGVSARERTGPSNVGPDAAPAGFVTTSAAEVQMHATTIASAERARDDRPGVTTFAPLFEAQRQEWVKNV